MQQVGARGFADALAVDPRQLPVPLPEVLTRRARINFGYIWVLHRKLVLRLVAAGIVVVGATALYEGRASVLQGFGMLVSLAQGQATKAGFAIGKITISGQSLTSEAEVLKALEIGPDASTFTYDVDAARARVMALPSVKTVSLRKVYPGELKVQIAEKVPVARWRIGDETYIVDDAGSPVAVDDGSWQSLPLVVGEGAADDAMVMLKALQRYPTLKEGLAALSRVGDRRWDLIFYSGLRVQLPELGVAQALAQLDAEQRDYQLLDHDVTVIDLRVPGMMSLTPGELSKAQLQADAKKNKRVVKGDAEYETAAERAAESKGQ